MAAAPKTVKKGRLIQVPTLELDDTAATEADYMRMIDNQPVFATWMRRNTTWSAEEVLPFQCTRQKLEVEYSTYNIRTVMYIP